MNDLTDNMYFIFCRFDILYLYQYEYKIANISF